MATGCDSAVGYSLLFSAATVFIYYAFWIVILPFVDPDHVIQLLFLPRVYAVAVPIVVGVVVLIALTLYIAVVTVKKTSTAKEKTS